MKNQNPFDLTFAECRQIIQNGGDLRSIVESLNDQPEWLLAMGGINSLAELQSVAVGGCESGAFMPAVAYHTANKVMAEYGDYVIAYLEDLALEFKLDPAIHSWRGFACKVLSSAVDSWAHSAYYGNDLESVGVS